MDTAINATYQMFRNDDDTAWIAVEGDDIIFFASDSRFTEEKATELFATEVKIRTDGSVRLLPTETGFYAAVKRVTR